MAGNIRELENVLEKAAVMAEDSLIREEDVVLYNPIAGNKIAYSLKERLDDYEKKYWSRHLGNSWRQKENSDFLGLSKTNLFDKIHKYGINDREAGDDYDEHYR